MAGTANADMTGIDVDLDSLSFIIPSSQELQDTSRNNSGDIFLTIQSATTTVSKIYTEYFALSKVDFSSSLLDRCDIEDLRYVRDMLVSIVKRKLKQLEGESCKGHLQLILSWRRCHPVSPKANDQM